MYNIYGMWQKKQNSYLILLNEKQSMLKMLSNQLLNLWTLLRQVIKEMETQDEVFSLKQLQEIAKNKNDIPLPFSEEKVIM